MKRFMGFVISLVLLASVFTFSASAASSAVYSAQDLFTERDLLQTPDLTDAAACVLSDGQDVLIDSAGVYVLTGTASGVTVTVEAGKDDKVQLVLNGVSVSNADFPVIYVKSADKVFVTVSADSSLSVTGKFRADGSTNTDGVVFSKAALTLNGTATLTVSSSENGIVGKDDVRITGGTYRVSASSKAIEANDSIRISGGTLDLTAGTDGLHADNDEDAEKGFVYIGGGSLTINAGDDGVHGVTVVQIDSGTLDIRASEGIEGTYVQINGGVISDDGINAARKSGAYTPTVEINDGDITIVIGSGDTDGIDANGNIVVNGGVIRVTGNSAFDYDGSARYNGGTIIINGQQVSSIPNSMMGGGRGGWGGHGGGRGGRGGW